jgi:nucleoside-diphosphate-sugar epimerase
METVLITGATGYLGSLVAAAFLEDGPSRLVLPIRRGRDPRSVVACIAKEAARTGTLRSRRELDRIIVVPISDPANSTDLLPALQRFPISEVIHCAGCVNYFDAEKLRVGNVLLTRALLDVSKRLRVNRFIHLSSAFCSGYVEGLIREELHATPATEPSPYMASKREAEMMVATSGLPYLIIRPSIVIGDSRDGHYSGKLSGLYQIWWAAKRYLSHRQTSVIHAVAPDIPLHVVHQDAFQSGFLGACRHLPDNSIIHLVSRDAILPTVRQVCDTLVAQHLANREIRYYERLSEIPTDEIDRNMRRFITAVATNLDICSHRWLFESRWIEHLRSMGIPLADASIHTVSTCQDRFLSPSQRFYEPRRHAALQAATQAGTAS